MVVKEPFLIKRRNRMDWTDEQKQAIYTNGSNILVAAAARKWKNSCASGEDNK